MKLGYDKARYLLALGERMVQIARRGERDQVGCIVLGRGADEAKVRGGLTVAAGVPGFIGKRRLRRC